MTVMAVILKLPEPSGKKRPPAAIIMSPEGFATLLATCSEPGAPAPEMVEVIRRPAPWEQGQHLLRGGRI